MPGFTRDTKPYLTLVDGHFCQKVTEDTPGAKKRDYENKKTGEKGTKWELVYDYWVGCIRDIKFKEFDFGEMCSIELEDSIISLGTDSRYFQDLAQRIAGVSFDEEITFRPFSITDGDKTNSGIAISVKGEKIKSYFKDSDRKPLHGFPVPQKHSDAMNKDQWKIYFINVKTFLVDYLTNKIEQYKNSYALKVEEAKQVFGQETAKEKTARLVDEGKNTRLDEIDPESLPF